MWRPRVFHFGQSRAEHRKWHPLRLRRT
jgi:hypothetical protein